MLQDGFLNCIIMTEEEKFYQSLLAEIQAILDNKEMNDREKLGRVLLRSTSIVQFDVFNSAFKNH